MKKLILILILFVSFNINAQEQLLQSYDTELYGDDLNSLKVIGHNVKLYHNDISKEIIIYKNKEYIKFKLGDKTLDTDKVIYFNLYLNNELYTMCLIKDGKNTVVIKDNLGKFYMLKNN